MGLTLASFFSGAGGLDTGFHNAGFDVEWSNEFNKQITPTLQANFPETRIDNRSLTDIQSTQIPDNMTGLVGGPPCFPAGHFVLTNVGYKDISEIAIGDIVLTHSGRYRKVFDIGNAQSHLIKIKIFGSLIITTTKEHPFYVVERTEAPKEKWNSPTVYVFSEPHWVNAGDLTANHFVISPMDSFRETSEKNLTVEEAYFIGRWVGDGWLRKTDQTGRYNKTLKNGTKIYRKSGFKKTIHICGSYKEEKKLYDIFESMFATFHFSRMKTVVRFSGYSKRLFDLLETFGSGAYNKNFPTWVFSEPKDIQKEILKGYLESDGTFDGEKYTITTISPKLALGIQRLVRNVYNINPSLTKTIRPKTAIIQGREVNQKDTYQIRWFIKGNKTTSIVDSQMTLSKVFSVEQTQEKETVYNFSVEEDQTYTINNFAVHNCQSWSLGGHGKGLEDKRGHVFLDYIRVINDKQPLFFLAENVKGMLAKTRQKDLQQILDAFDQLGYNITYQLVNAHDYNVPQDRWRLFFVGYRKDTNLTFTFPEPNKAKPTLKNTIWDLRNTATPALDKDKTNGDIEIPNHEYSTGTFSSQYMSRNRVREWNQPSFTIQASGRQAPLHPDSGKMRKINNDLYEFNNPNNYRRLSVRETARIQTFPDTYQFKYNTLDLGYKMIGNAVPVNLAEAMANKIKQDLQTL